MMYKKVWFLVSCVALGLLILPVQPSVHAQEPSSPAAEFGVCGGTATRIHAIQGSGTTSPMNGTTEVVVEAVVVGTFQAANQLGGFFLQERDSLIDGNSATSEGIFVHDNGFGVAVSLGRLVRVRGDVAEVGGETRLVNIVNVADCGTATATMVNVSLPTPSAGYLERYEGMLVNFNQTLYVTDSSQLGSAGQVGLSANAPLVYPTNLHRPGTTGATNLLAQNPLNFVYLDDGRNETYYNPITHLQAGNTLRVGSTVTNLSGPLGFSGGQYRVHRGSQVTFNGITNPRQANPTPIESDIKMAVIDANNYATTLGIGGPIDAQERDRHRTKLANTIILSGADIVVLTGVQNNGDAGSSAIYDLVNGSGGINNILGGSIFGYVPDVGGGLGSDPFKVAIVYRVSRVSRIGAPVTTSNAPFNTIRRPLVQTFNASGDYFTVAGVYLPTRACTGSPTGLNLDQGDGQGCWNQIRTQAANTLATWLATDPTNSDDDDFVILGNFNAFGLEDPIFALTNTHSYTNLVNTLAENQRYTFNAGAHNGLGYTTHALVNSAFNEKVTGLTIWKINADEPTDTLDYRVGTKPAPIWEMGANIVYASSAYNPIVIGFDVVPNSAPIVSGTGNLSPINEDVPASGNNGNLLFDLVNPMISDLDPSDPKGVAVITVDNSSGQWQYALNGTDWQDLNAATVAFNQALLLAADGNTRVRFLPNANYHGTVNGGVIFHAWDQTDDLLEGIKVNLASIGTGDPHPYSLGTGRFNILVRPIADTPSVTNAITPQNQQTTSGLVITRNPVDGNEVTHFKINGISDGFLFQNNGSTLIGNGQFITVAEGNAGLKFTPTSSNNGSFQIQASIGNTDAGLGGQVISATITVLAVANTPSVTNATTLEDTQSTSGLVVTRHPNDGPAVNFFRITNISGGTLYHHDGTTSITNNQFITYAQAHAGLKFTPLANSIAQGSFRVQASTTSDNVGLGGQQVTATITIIPVNDPPSFVKGPNQKTGWNRPLQTVPNWATDISPGPPDEFMQSVFFTAQVTATTGDLAFSIPPAISPTGTLSYQTAPNKFGTATISVQLSDSGGTANNGIDTSPPQTFTISVFRPDTVLSLDQPAPDAFVTSNYTVSGWALDRALGANMGIGVDLVQVFAGSSCTGTLLGQVAPNIPRPDVAAALSLDSSYTNSGWSINVTNQPGGPRTITVCVRTTVDNTYGAVITRKFNIPAPVTGAETLAAFNLGSGFASLLNTIQDQPPESAYLYFAPGAPVNGQWVMGDWNGNGQQTPGVFNGGAFHFTNDLGGTTNWSALWLGPNGQPIAGRFNAAVNHDCVGVIEQATLDSFIVFVLWYTCTFNTTTPPVTWHWLSAPLQTAEGFSGTHQFASGDWNNNGIDTIAVRRGEFVAYSNVRIVDPTYAGGPPFSPVNTGAEFAFAQYFGTAPTALGEGVFLAGDWNNDGVDSFGVLYDNNHFYYRNDLEWNSGVFNLQSLGNIVGAPRSVMSWASSSVSADMFASLRAGATLTASGALVAGGITPDLEESGLSPLESLPQSDNFDALSPLD